MGQVATGAVLQGCWRSGVVPAVAREAVLGAWSQPPAPGAACSRHSEASLAILLRRKNGTATTPYNRLPPEAVFANVLGLLIVLFGVLVLCALAKPDWKRPEDDSTDTRQVLAVLQGCASAPTTAPAGPSLGWAGQGSAGSRLTPISLQPLLGTER